MKTGEKGEPKGRKEMKTGGKLQGREEGDGQRKVGHRGLSRTSGVIFCIFNQTTEGRGKIMQKKEVKGKAAAHEKRKTKKPFTALKKN